MDKVTAFDALFTNNQIQKLKVLVSYVDSPLQHQLAIYIKFLELKYTLDLFQHYPELSVSPHSQESPPDPARLCQEFTPYCTPQEQKQLSQFTSLFQSMSHYQEMMEMVQLFQEMFPQGMSFPGGDSSGNTENTDGEPAKTANSAGDTASGACPDTMAAGLSSLFGESMPDLSQFMTIMHMMQSDSSSPPEEGSIDMPSPE